MWLIRTAAEARRDDLARQLNDIFWPEPPSPTALTTFHTADNAIAQRVLADGERVEQLNSIDRDRVHVLDQDSGADPGWYAITADGIVLFRDALAALVTEQEVRNGVIETELSRRADPPSC